KFLGIIINQELRFSAHATYVITKGTKYVLACKHLIKVSKGTKIRIMKKLYEVITVPKMLYAVKVWGSTMLQRGTSKKKKGWNAQSFAKKMESVQRAVATLIAGGMHSSAINLLPIPA
ncbi:hypothetical protein HD554DRAFT_2004245, partial [Boletus coccyginus]